MISAVMPPPPRWLAVQILLGSLLLAAIIGGGQFEWSDGLLARSSRSVGILLIALTVAASAGYSLTWLANSCGRPVAVCVAFLGRVLALFPVAVLAWGFVSWWVGSLGWPIETLMPVQLSSVSTDSRTVLGASLWEYLAPALVLTVPLFGEVIASAHIPMRARMQAICMYAPAWLIIIEDVLHFMGWGGWMAQNIRAGDMPAIAAGFVASGIFIALLCSLFSEFQTPHRENKWQLAGLCWLPWPLWALGALGLGVHPSTSWELIWLALLIGGSAGWLHSFIQLKSKWLSQARCFIAWCLELLAGIVLWGAAACYLRPALAQPLGDSIARICRPLAITSLEEAAQTLADPTLILRSGGIILLAALCLFQISRIIRPCPPSHSSKPAI